MKNCRTLNLGKIYWAASWGYCSDLVGRSCSDIVVILYPIQQTTTRPDRGSINFRSGLVVVAVKGTILLQYRYKITTSWGYCSDLVVMLYPILGLGLAPIERWLAHHQKWVGLKKLYYYLRSLNKLLNPTHFWWWSNQRSIGASPCPSIGYNIATISLQDHYNILKMRPIVLFHY